MSLLNVFLLCSISIYFRLHMCADEDVQCVVLAHSLIEALVSFVGLTQSHTIMRNSYSMLVHSTKHFSLTMATQKL